MLQVYRTTDVGRERQEEYKMARNLNPIVKLSRREGFELHPKAIKGMTRRNYAPGQHGQSRRAKPSDYAIQLREKQKVKRIYGVLEKQFRNYVTNAEKTEGVSGEILLKLLEKRLDNVIYRANIATSRQAARQLVTHGHFMLNGKKVDIPSISVKAKDVISLKPKSQKNTYFQSLQKQLDESTNSTSWLKLDSKKMTVTVTGEPEREEVIEPISEQLIIEYYSR